MSLGFVDCYDRDKQTDVVCIGFDRHRDIVVFNQCVDIDGA